MEMIFIFQWVRSVMLKMKEDFHGIFHSTYVLLFRARIQPIDSKLNTDDSHSRLSGHIKKASGPHDDQNRTQPSHSIPGFY